MLKPRATQGSQDLDELVGLGTGKRGRGFIKDEDANLPPQGLGDLDLLPLADCQRTDRRPGIELEAELVQKALRVSCNRSPVDPRSEPGLVAERQVLGDGERLDQVQLLMNDADSCGERGGGIMEPDRLAADLDRAQVRTEHASQHLDQCALAGTILTAEGMNLATAQLEVDTVQSLDRGESLGYLAEDNAGPVDRRDGRVLLLGHGVSGGMNTAKARRRARDRPTEGPCRASCSELGRPFRSHRPRAARKFGCRQFRFRW